MVSPGGINTFPLLWEYWVNSDAVPVSPGDIWDHSLLLCNSGLLGVFGVTALSGHSAEHFHGRGRPEEALEA